MTLTALIVDDEEYSRKSLYYLLQEYCPEVQIAAIVNSVAEAREQLRTKQVNLIFLDVAMPRESGFELLPDLKSSNTLVIFTTAYDHYALKALKASAIDYLLKPIDIEELKAAVKKAHDQMLLISERGTATSDSRQPDLNLPDDGTITIPHTHGFDVINTSEIVYIEADSNYSIFHLKNTGKMVVAKPLKEFEEMLAGKAFLRIHKSVIVNFKYVKAYSHRNGLQVILKDGSALPVSRRRLNEFQEKAKAFFKG